MPVVIVSQPGLTREKYEETVRRIFPGGRLSSPEDFPVEGMLVHIAGESPNGFRVVEVWESEDALRRYAEILVPVLQEQGLGGEPEVYPTHVFVTT
jgi:hypothetical protein